MSSVAVAECLDNDQEYEYSLFSLEALDEIEAICLFLDKNNEVIINRNNLFGVARKFIEKNKDFNPPMKCKFKLSGNQVRQKMQKKLDELYNNKKILDHGMVVGKELAYVLSGGDTEKNKEISEDQMYNLELNSFMKLLETQNTQNRIAHTLKTGKPLIN